MFQLPLTLNASVQYSCENRALNYRRSVLVNLPLIVQREQARVAEVKRKRTLPKRGKNGMHDSNTGEVLTNTVSTSSNND